MQTNVRDFGARGNGQDLDTTAIQTAIYACAQAGGGTVVIPAGHYVIGSLFLRDHITLSSRAAGRAWTKKSMLRSSPVVAFATSPSSGAGP